MEAMVLTASLDASDARMPGNDPVFFEAGFPVRAPPEEVKGAVDEMTQICSGIVAGRIEPGVQQITRTAGVIPGGWVEIFSLEFRYIDNHGQCDWKVRPMVNPRLIMIDDGLITQIAEKCAERCVQVMADRFSDCAAVRTWTII
jgi:carbon monoxide dehydrogenase subunit G